MAKLKTKKAKHATPKNSKASKKAARDAKRAARKGDGSFPDILIVTKPSRELYKDAPKNAFVGHGEDLSGLTTDGETVAVYKLRRVSTIAINRKVAR